MTRNVWKTLLLTLFLQPCAFAATAGTPNGMAQPLFLSLVMDSSPTSAQTWHQLKASACQAIDSLHQNDRVEILRARDGEPALHSDSLIQSPNLSGRQNLRQCIRDIHQVFFLARADVAKAVAVAFEHLGKHSDEYRCAVLVVSAGHLTDDQVRQIRRLAAAYKIRGWSLAFLVQQGARRDLFLAASQNEFDVMFLDKANLAQWLDKARNQGPGKPEKTVEPPRLSPPQRTPPIETRLPPAPTPPRVSPPQTPIAPEPKPLPAPKELERARGEREPNGPATRYLLPVYPVPQDRLPLPTLPETTRPVPSQIPSRKTPKQPWLSPLLKNKYVPAVAVGAVLLGVVLLVILVAKLRRGGDGLPDLDEYGPSGAPGKLMCEVGDQLYDLGEEATIDTLVIGKDPTSAVVLADDEELEDEHVKIIHRRRGWQIKNLATQPIVVDGTPVKKGHKLDLFLPATIELTQQSRITLSRQPVLVPDREMQTTGETYAIDDI